MYVFRHTIHTSHLINSIFLYTLYGQYQLILLSLTSKQIQVTYTVIKKLSNIQYLKNLILIFQVAHK